MKGYHGGECDDLAMCQNCADMTRNPPWCEECDQFFEECRNCGNWHCLSCGCKTTGRCRAMMDELLKGLARKLHDDTKYGMFSSYEDVIAAFERVLRDVGLDELLEAAEKVREWSSYHHRSEVIACDSYDSALERVRAALAGAEKGREDARES